jgi:uncharacterized protein YggL (DUF469 family)
MSHRLAPDGREPVAPWDPGLTDAEVEKIENEVEPEDLQTAADEQALRDIRRRQDQAWLDEVRAADFIGPAFELYWEELMRYGMAVMLSWTRTGKIISECKKKNRPLERPERGPGRWSYTDRLELAGETVAVALKYFLEKVLKPGRWYYGGGAALRTFFVGACLLQFPNVYNRWAGEQHRWSEAHDGRATLEDVEMQWVAGDLVWKDPTGNAVLHKDIEEEICDRFEDRGDGVLALIHPADHVPTTYLLSRFMPELCRLLVEYNHALPAAERARPAATRRRARG